MYIYIYIKNIITLFFKETASSTTYFLLLPAITARFL